MALRKEVGRNGARDGAGKELILGMPQRTKRRYSPEESVIVIERLLDGEDGWSFRDRTNEYVLFRCPGCGEDSYRVYLDSGRASCSNDACTEMPAKSEPLFAAVARLCGYDKQAQKAEVWDRIEGELRAHEEDQRRREIEERHELEAYVGTLEEELAAERRRVASASEDARVLGDRNAALEAQDDELRRALGTRTRYRATRSRLPRATAPEARNLTPACTPPCPRASLRVRSAGLSPPASPASSGPALCPWRRGAPTS